MKDPPETQQSEYDEQPVAVRSEVERENPRQLDKTARSADDAEGLYEALDQSLTTDQRKRLADLERVFTSNLQAHETMRSITSLEVSDHDGPGYRPPAYTMAGEMWKLERDMAAFGTAAVRVAAEALITMSSASVFRARLGSYERQLVEWLLTKVKEEDRHLFDEIPVKDAIKKVVSAYTKKADLEAPPPWRRIPERSEAKSTPADAFGPRASEIARRERSSSEDRNEGAAPLAHPPSPKRESEARPEVCFVEWGSMPGEPTPLRLSHTGFVLANDGITAHDVSIEDFTVGDELWTAEKLARIKGNGEAFMLVSSKAAVQKWNLLGAINHAASVRNADAPDESAYIVRIRARYRNASNVWYRSWADLTYTEFGTESWAASVRANRNRVP